MSPHNFTSRGYLERARARIAEGSDEALLYAALELRCGIEARLSEYLEAQTHISEKLRTGWQIAAMAKNLQKAFDIGEKFLLVRVVDATTLEELTFFLYTPVTKKTQALAGALGEFLHAPQGKRDDAWWQRVKACVIDAAAGLENATRGNLLGVPLMRPGTSSFSIRAESWERNDPRPQILDSLKTAERPFKIEVRYFDELVRQA